jgi:hypothetical protein
MVNLLSATFLLLLGSFSFPFGYLLGVYTEEEITSISRAVKSDKIFGWYFIAVEILLLSVLYAGLQAYFVVALAAIMLINLALSAFYTVIKYDFVRLILYQILFLAATIILLIAIEVL